jgi:hypothetical protein
LRLTPILLGLLALAAPPLAVAADANSGHVILDARLRYEVVAQDGFAKDAQAFTLRTRLGYETPAWRGFRGLIEGENITALSDDYNSTTNGKTSVPTVADPEVTQLNRAQISWTGTDADVVAGRQRIILGNARFVGNVGFRQTEQTFEAVRIGLRPTRALTLTYVYVDKVHRVFTRESPQGEWTSDSHLLQADLKTGVGQFTGYGYLLDIRNAPLQSSSTWGGRFAGSRPLRLGLALTYEVEAARQTDYGNSPTAFDVGYLDLGAGLKGQSQWATLGYERLEGNGRRAFQTPLATLHTYQGWADVFLTTPPSGVRDLNVRLGSLLKLGPKATPLKLQAAVHDFTDDDGSARYGREFDLLAGLPLSKTLTAEIKGAFFEGARPGFADRHKIWLTLEAKY